MPITGLFFHPLPPNTPSPTPTLVSHLTRKYPATPLPAYSLDHRLLFDTSSLLPSHDVFIRRYTHFLTLSHLPGQTYVGTSVQGKPRGTPEQAGPANRPTEMSLLVLPAGPPAEEFLSIILRKMEPLWSFRSAIRIENGVALELGGGDWRVRIGDAGIVGGQGQGRLRGTVVEVEFLGEEDDDGSEDGNGEGEVDWEVREAMLKAFWESLIERSNSGIGIEGMGVVVKVPGIKTKEELKGEGLVRQYMELLRFARP